MGDALHMTIPSFWYFAWPHMLSRLIRRWIEPHVSYQTLIWFEVGQLSHRAIKRQPRMFFTPSRVVIISSSSIRVAWQASTNASVIFSHFSWRYRIVVAFSETMSFPNYKKVHSRFQHWCRNEVFRMSWQALPIRWEIKENRWTRKLYRCHLCLWPKAAVADIGKTKRGKGVKIMESLIGMGFCLLFVLMAANHHEVTLVQLTFDFLYDRSEAEKLMRQGIWQRWPG